MKRYINLDMDGVVADFNSYTGEILGRRIGWEGRDLTSEEWNKISSIDNYYFKFRPARRRRQGTRFGRNRIFYKSENINR